MNLAESRLPAAATEILEKLAYPAEVKAHIGYILRESPARAPSGKRCVRHRYYSTKTKKWCLLEGNVAWATAVQLDHDPEVLWWCHETPKFTISGIEVVNRGQPDESARDIHVGHFADFFVIYREHCAYRETKPSERFIALCQEQGWRYAQDPIGRVISPPAIKAAREQGFDYECCDETSIPALLLRNLLILDPLLPEKRELCETDRRIAEYVKKHDGCWIEEVELRLGVGGADVRAAIALNQIYVDLTTVDLASSSPLRLYSSKTAADLLAQIEAHASAPAHLGVLRMPELKRGEIIVIDNERYRVAGVLGSEVGLECPDGKLKHLHCGFIEKLFGEGRAMSLGFGSEEAQWALEALFADDKLLKIAEKRYRRIEGFLAQIENCSGRVRYEKGREPDRTEQRWIRRYLASEKACGTGLLGLVPQYHKRGPRHSLLNKEQEQAIAVFIEHCHAHPDAPSGTLTYGAYLSYLRDNLLTHLKVCRSTFDARIRQARHFVTRRREGDGGAALIEPPYMLLTYMTPRHGSFPWQVVHIDHSPLDIETIDPVTKKNLGKAWLTVMYDGATRRVLSHYLSYDAPSYASVYAVLRICLEKHGRLPVMLVLDNGSEFASESLELMQYGLRIQVRFRPARRPRWGSIVERFFGTTEGSMFHNLRGNTTLAAKGIYLDAAHDPAKRACFSLEQVDAIFSAFAYDFYDTQDHPALLTSPRAAYFEGMREFGNRLRTAPNQFVTRILLLPIPRRSRGLAKVQKRVGVQIGYYRYWNNLFNDPQLEGKFIPVRYDPLNRVIAYAWIRGRWHICTCRELEQLLASGGVGLQCLSAAIGYMRGKHGRSYNERVVALADFVRSHVATKDFGIELARRAATDALFTTKVSTVTIHGDVAQNADSMRAGPPPVLLPEHRSVHPSKGEREPGETATSEDEAEEPTPLDATFEGQFEDDVEI